MMELNTCTEFLRQHDRYIIITHRRPDGDTLGSAAGLCHALNRIGKQAYLFPNPEITGTFRPYVEKYLAPSDYRWDTVIATDVADASLICPGFDGAVDLWLDHHPTRGTPRENAVVWSDKASCGELIMALVETLCGDIQPEEADLLYMAVSTDTGCFVYDNTKADTHRAAARLMDAGANVPLLNKPLFRFKSMARILLEGMICADMRSFRDGQISVAVITLDMFRRSGATEDDCNDLASLAGQVMGNKAAITVRELRSDPPLTKVSIRTDGIVDASHICALFGGGGHRMAAGCELPLPPEETAQNVYEAVEEAWP